MTNPSMIFNFDLDLDMIDYLSLILRFSANLCIYYIIYLLHRNGKVLQKLLKEKLEPNKTPDFSQ